VWGEEFAIFGSEPVQDLTGDNLKRGLEALKRMEGEVRDFHKIGGDPFQLVSQGAYWFQREYAREWPADDYPGWAEYLERTRNEADAR